MSTQAAPQVVILKIEKSPGLAFALAFFFGPIGLLYSTPVGALVMFLINLFVGFVTVGIGLIFTWPVCCVWGYLAANSYNAKLKARS